MMTFSLPPFFRLIYTVVAATSLFISSTEAVSSTTSSTSTTTLPPTPTFLYPVTSPTLNFKDSLNVVYQTPWDAANLTVFCFVNPAAHLWSWYEAQNPVFGSGVYNFQDIQGKIEIPQYPVTCHLLMQEFRNDTNNINGAIFTITSTVGAASTYSTSTDVVGATKTQGRHGDSVAAEKGTNTPSPASGASGASGPMTNLSGGAYAGIGVGVVAGVALVVAAVVFALRMRQRLRRVEELTATPNTDLSKTVHPYNGGGGGGGSPFALHTSSASPAPQYENLAHEVPAGNAREIYESGGQPIAKLQQPPAEMGVTTPYPWKASGPGAEELWLDTGFDRSAYLVEQNDFRNRHLSEEKRTQEDT